MQNITNFLFVSSDFIDGDGKMKERNTIFKHTSVLLRDNQVHKERREGGITLGRIRLGWIFYRRKISCWWRKQSILDVLWRKYGRPRRAAAEASVGRNWSASASEQVLLDAMSGTTGFDSKWWKVQSDKNEEVELVVEAKMFTYLCIFLKFLPLF